MKRLRLFEHRNKDTYNQYEEMLSSMKISKRQLKIISEYFLPKFSQFKSKLKNAINNLNSIKIEILSTLAESDSLNRLMEKIKFFTPLQIIEMDNFLQTNVSQHTVSAPKFINNDRKDKALSFTYQLNQFMTRRSLKSSNYEEIRHMYKV